VLLTMQFQVEDAIRETCSDDELWRLWANHNSVRQSIPEQRRIAIGHRRHLALLGNHFGFEPLTPELGTCCNEFVAFLEMDRFISAYLGHNGILLMPAEVTYVTRQYSSPRRIPAEELTKIVARVERHF